MTFKIVLHGGPKDGEILQIDEYTNNYRRIRVPIATVPFFKNDLEHIDDTDVLFKIGLYECTHMHAGMPGTTEYRHWYEWTWKGLQ